MASLQNAQIDQTYSALLKVGDNGEVNAQQMYLTLLTVVNQYLYHHTVQPHIGTQLVWFTADQILVYQQ